ncbi:hypothetical protein [Natronococcus wangiae]|uniref:hypothetical protein n=1 Tax=Natronococcus wangiae TaxID=3068275 RepID=UPI00273E6F89|nr:hypothetical protein [Natronococcus sp. AD5]
MEGSENERSRIANNRLAAAVVVGSLCLVAAVWLLAQVGLLGDLIPARGPAADAVPLYLLVGLVAVGLVVWSWRRVLSFFE